MNVTTTTPVGRIAAEHPLATRVFARHAIDFCCGGGRPLDEVCRERGLAADAVVTEIRREIEASPDSPQRWDQATPVELIEHILQAYHVPLWEELPRLDGMARKVLEVHHDKNPAGLTELVQVFAALRAELEAHLQKEEQILFPMIRQGHGRQAGGPVSVMMREHDGAGAMLRRLRELTDDYTVPAEACNTWTALWHGLAALESDLHQHIHLENNLLFPKVLAG